VILVYPLLVIGAAVLIRRTGRRHRGGWSGFVAWATAGAVFTFSLLSGFGIGLFLLPLVAALLYLAVRCAPDFRASLGFGGGIGATLVAIASIVNFSLAWLIPGIALGVAAVALFVGAEQLHPPTGS
jgi:hypothetical protein